MSAPLSNENKQEGVEAETQIEGAKVLDNLNEQLRVIHGWKYGSLTLATILGFSAIAVNYAARNLTFANPNTGLTLALEATIFFAVAAGSSVAGGIFQWRENQFQNEIDAETQRQRELEVVDAIQTIEKVQD